jgi:cytochrome oxidase Cu insertion factor (SCO1/SenC/PrrC family)
LSARLAIATAIACAAWGVALACAREDEPHGHGGAHGDPADHAGHAVRPEEPEAPALLYELPAAGSYALPPIDTVRDHTLVRSDGPTDALLSLQPGQLAVVSFVYLHCSDAAGCPLVLETLRRADRALAARPDLAPRVRLATVSFDPARDTPAALADMREHLAPRSDWRFFTAASEPDLAPVLRDFGQDAVPVLSAGGANAGIMRHVAKVFLVDAGGAVRNVYSSGFLDHRLMVRDIETLLLE